MPYDFSFPLILVSFVQMTCTNPTFHLHVNRSVFPENCFKETEYSGLKVHTLDSAKRDEKTGKLEVRDAGKDTSVVFVSLGTHLMHCSCVEFTSNLTLYSDNLAITKQKRFCSVSGSRRVCSMRLPSDTSAPSSSLFTPRTMTGQTSCSRLTR